MVSLLQTIFDYYILLKTQIKYLNDCTPFGIKFCLLVVEWPVFDQKMCLFLVKLVESLIESLFKKADCEYDFL